jgi:hypothetical protein
MGVLHRGGRGYLKDFLWPFIRGWTVHAHFVHLWTGVNLCSRQISP